MIDEENQIAQLGGFADDVIGVGELLANEDGVGKAIVGCGVPEIERCPVAIEFAIGGGADRTRIGVSS